MAGLVTVIGPFRCDDVAGIHTALEAAIKTKLDLITSWTSGNLVWFSLTDAT